MEQKIRLTEYSHGGGCGCKIAPRVLEEILSGVQAMPEDKKLLVGNATNDDAAVYDLGNGQALISTTDFFMPIVDDANAFGKIAACNSISDVYAMGGQPILAIAILGWPVNTIPLSEAQKVLNGAREICVQAGISLAGGHSIDSKEPIFGLAVNGLVSIENLKQNNTAKAGDLIYLTKPIGVGIMSTAQKRKLLKEEHEPALIEQLTTLNKIGALLGKQNFVTSMTDVTGFGLIGHLAEMAKGANVSAEISYSAIPKMDFVEEYIALKSIPDATSRNWQAHGTVVSFEKGVDVMQAFNLLPDPQTNGGLIIAISPDAKEQMEQLLKENGLEKFASPIGRFVARSEKLIEVKV